MPSIVKIAILFLCILVVNATPSTVAAQDERLQLYALLNSVEGKLVTKGVAQELNKRLTDQGYISEGSNNQSLKLAVVPTLAFDQNINGGNPSRDLVLGNIRFVGDKALHEKSGVLAGGFLDAKGRQIIGAGHYLTYGLRGGYSYNETHNVSVVRTNFNFCAINNVESWSYLDVCANHSIVNKAITRNSTTNFNFSLTHLFTSSTGNYHKTTWSMNRLFTDEYEQDQIILDFTSILDNHSTAIISLTAGEAVDDQLVTQLSMSGRYGTKLGNRNVWLGANFSTASGGKLLGFDRSDKVSHVSITYQLSDQLTATLGFQNTDSSIDYFDATFPTLAFEVKLFNF